jgi:hypothetical protein
VVSILDAGYWILDEKPPILKGVSFIHLSRSNEPVSGSLRYLRLSFTTYYGNLPTLPKICSDNLKRDWVLR